MSDVNHGPLVTAYDEIPKASLKTGRNPDVDTLPLLWVMTELRCVATKKDYVSSLESAGHITYFSTLRGRKLATCAKHNLNLQLLTSSFKENDVKQRDVNQATFTRPSRW